MSDMQITYEEMRAAGKDLNGGKEEMDARLQQLKGRIDQLVSGGFVTGKASPQFQSSYEEFNTGVKKVLEGLHGMAQFLDQAAQAYEETDAQLAQALNK